jgi:hypothetical protein
MSQGVEPLPSKLKAPSSNPSAATKVGHSKIRIKRVIANTQTRSSHSLSSSSIMHYTKVCCNFYNFFLQYWELNLGLCTWKHSTTWAYVSICKLTSIYPYTHVYISIFTCSFETGSCCVAQAGFELPFFPCQPPKFCDYSCVPPHLPQLNISNEEDNYWLLVCLECSADHLPCSRHYSSKHCQSQI